MNCNCKKRMWLAGASLLAIVLGTGDANAVIFQAVGGSEYIIPSTGLYDFTVAGAQGGALFGNGGDGALVGGDLFLKAGTTLDIVVGEMGGYLQGNGSGGGGGGGSFVFGTASLLFAAGGGSGAAFLGGGSPGIGSGGHPAGPASYGGAGGLGVPVAFPGTGPDYVPGLPATSGSFPNGGQGAMLCLASGGCSGLVAGPGGYGGGGGGYNGGGGGGGAPGGAAGQGGYSFVTGMARDPFGITGGNPGPDGYVSIGFVGSSVPESSTWAMMLAGFSVLGAMLLRRGRKGITPNW